MENQIREYVKTELTKLGGDVTSIKLTGVSASILSDLIEGWDWSEADTNGWQVDYWLKTDKYDIEGCMYDGTATITLLGEDE
ncbi:hypothetical protein PQE74_gp048 [Bacillus phage vB_BanS_Chewbecca]|uniref:Uncharacterized protein n=1 Tax=Bacillus phage vB_BanS_Chewbecca TaxID=2894786 RepID=A0AAE8YMF1_9CAUD|nr:hypothetical protein PQE74_gp048 [Bacillus phage vB_BanS_Chewbecca]UGO46131.1 hypothetical protein CHEWBECCA_48 [Bacillus phage vB_BanS_Chewbecca]